MDDRTPDHESLYTDDQDSVAALNDVDIARVPAPREHAEDMESLAAHSLRGADAAPISGVRILPEEGIDLRAAVEEFESNLIRQALVKTGGNKNKAAQLLRLNRTTLVEMVKRKRLYVA